MSKLFDEKSIIKITFNSNEKTSYFHLFICFISQYFEEFQNSLEKCFTIKQKELIILLYSLFFIFSFQAFISEVAELIKIYYHKYLENERFQIYIEGIEEYKYRIKARRIIINIYIYL